MSAMTTVATAIPIGIAFGFLLERSGLGDPRVILGQLVLRDFTVIRVMFGAIVTAMLLVVLGSALGWIDVASIAMPPTDLGAQALGGVIFGGGFALVALCPGTACVAAASGRRDGVVAVLGIFLGTLATPVLWPALGTAALAAPREGATLPVDLGLPAWTVVLAITMLGIAASMIARRVEHPTEGVWWHLRAVEAGALVLALGFAVAEGGSASEAPSVDALTLAAWIKEGRAGLRIIDVRDGLDSTTYMIPGASAVPLVRIASVTAKPGETIVLYSDGGAHAARAWERLRARGVSDGRVLRDGMAAWEDEVLAPRAPAVASDSAQRRYQRARALSLWFGGKPSLEPASGAKPPASARAKRRRNTC